MPQKGKPVVNLKREPAPVRIEYFPRQTHPGSVEPSFEADDDRTVAGPEPGIIAAAMEESVRRSKNLFQHGASLHTRPTVRVQAVPDPQRMEVELNLEEEAPSQEMEDGEPEEETLELKEVVEEGAPATQPLKTGSTPPNAGGVSRNLGRDNVADIQDGIAAAVSDLPEEESPANLVNPSELIQEVAARFASSDPGTTGKAPAASPSGKRGLWRYAGVLAITISGLGVLYGIKDHVLRQLDPEIVQKAQSVMSKIANRLPDWPSLKP